MYNNTHYLNGKETTLPLARCRYLSKSEYKRVLDLLAENRRYALSKIPELEQVIRDFNGRPAKAKFTAALEEHGFSFEREQIKVKVPSNCVLSDDETELIGRNHLDSARTEFEDGILCCSKLVLDEEGMIDAEATLATDDDDGTRYCMKWIKEELEDVSGTDRDEWLDRMNRVREELFAIRDKCPDELKYRLFTDFLNDVGRYE